MAYISSFTYCDAIQTEITSQGPRQQIMNPLQALILVGIPGNFSFAISCNIAGFDSSKENSVRIVFEDSHRNALYDTGETRFQDSSKQENKKEISNIQLNIDIRNLVFREEGLYSTKIFFNDEELGEYKIQVMIGEQS